jgi:cytochrome d ubiquinol oxidase subunit II
VIVSGLGGLGTLALVFRSKFQPARLSAAVAVAAIIAGWAAAQRPTVLPGLTLHQAAAGRSTLIAVIVAVLAGGAILAPSLGLLFRLLLAGRFDPAARPRPHTPTAPAGSARPARLARLAAASLLIGFVLLTVLENAIAHAFGVAALLAAAGLTFVAVSPTDVHEG